MLTENQIQFLNYVCPGKWTEIDSVVDVDCDVNIAGMNLTEIPVQFGQVNGFFKCSHNKLTTLKGCPYKVNDSFNCTNNYLTSLEGGPKEVGKHYQCILNKLTNLIGIGQVEGIVLYDNHNEIIEWIKREQKYSCLLGAPKEIREQFSPRILHLVDSGMYN